MGAITTEELHDHLVPRLPGSWFEEVEIAADDEEILVVGRIPEPDPDDTRGEALDDAACETEIAAFREATRPARMEIADEVERRLGRKVSWGARCGRVRALFTTNTVPVMTRLRLPERRVVDTLVDAGVARSRSDAVAWCVRRVAERDADWLAELREAFAQVADVRASGPGTG